MSKYDNHVACGHASEEVGASDVGRPICQTCGNPTPWDMPRIVVAPADEDWTEAFWEAGTCSVKCGVEYIREMEYDTYSVTFHLPQQSKFHLDTTYYVYETEEADTIVDEACAALGAGYYQVQNATSLPAEPRE